MFYCIQKDTKKSVQNWYSQYVSDNFVSENIKNHVAAGTVHDTCRSF